MSIEFADMQDPLLPFEPFWNVGKLLSGAIAIGYIVFAYAYGENWDAVWMFLFVLVLVACIWFPDAMGAYIGYGVTSVGITKESNPAFLYTAAWLVLLLPLLLAPLAYYLLKR